jgi:hypothetical protein
LANVSQNAGVPLVIGGALITLLGLGLWNYFHEEEAAVAVIIVGSIFLGLGCLWWVVGLVQVVFWPGALTFQITNHDVALPSYNRSKSQPLHMIEVILRGRLVNGSARKATVRAIGAKLQRKRWMFWWGFVCHASVTNTIGVFGGTHDLTYHPPVEVDGDSTNTTIREVWAYFDVPADWDRERLISGRYRTILNIVPWGQRQGPGTKCEFDLVDLVPQREESHQRFMESEYFRSTHERSISGGNEGDT